MLKQLISYRPIDEAFKCLLRTFQQNRVASTVMQACNKQRLSDIILSIINDYELPLQ